MRTDDNALFDEIPGSASLGADESPVAADEAVEQAALADIGGAKDDGLDAVAQEFAVVAGSEQTVGLTGQPGELGRYDLAVFSGRFMPR